MSYTQEDLDKALNNLKSGVLGTRKQGTWDFIAKKTGVSRFTKKSVIEEGSQYNTLGEFQKTHSSAYAYAKRYNLFSKMNFKKVKRHEGFTKEQVHKIALEFNNRWDFQQGDNPAYHWAQRNNLLDDICSHMKPQRKSWNKELVLQEAKKYPNSVEFKKHSGSAYMWAVKHKITKELVYNR